MVYAPVSHRRFCVTADGRQYQEFATVMAVARYVAARGVMLAAISAAQETRIFLLKIDVVSGA